MITSVAQGRRDPKINMFCPEWHHHHGIKMHIEKLDKENGTLIISGSAAKVLIQKASLLFPDAEGWFVDWEVVQCEPFRVGAHGRAHFDDADLARAFGLSEDLDKTGEWLIERFGGDVAAHGKYIRWHEYLNIPCPGTGHDGDPNISIWLRHDIITAVRDLLEG